jgi:hypothetical protein
MVKLLVGLDFGLKSGWLKNPGSRRQGGGGGEPR